jgi:hypothetical protein
MLTYLIGRNSGHVLQPLVILVQQHERFRWFVLT